VLAYAAAHQQPSLWRQLRWLLLRGLLKQRRAWTWASPPTPLVDLLLVVGAGLIVGFIHSGHDTLQQAPQQVGAGKEGERWLCCCACLWTVPVRMRCSSLWRSPRYSPRL
jgi:hypothetical protein